MVYQHPAAVLTKASIVVMLVVALSACSDSPSTPTPPTPTPTPTPAPVQLGVFVDPATGLGTSDVRDVQGQVVRFDRANNSLIWAADGRSGFPQPGIYLSDLQHQSTFSRWDGCLGASEPGLKAI